MKLRNDRVTRGIQVTYRNGSTERSVQVFCVSNSIYKDYRGKPLVEAEPRLNLSGIPGLRRYCIGIVAESHLSESRNYIRNRIPAFLGSVEVWVQIGASSIDTERRQQILEAISAVQQELGEVR